MKLEFYSQLCDVCDQILIENKSDPDVLCLPWLHVLGHHPSLIKSHESLSRALSIQFGCQLIGLIARFIRNIFAGRTETNSLWEPVDKGFDVLIVSNLISRELLAQEADFYYGDLGKKIEEKGFRVQYALIDHTGCRESLRDSGLKVSQSGKSLLPDRLTVLAEIRILCRLLRASRKLASQAKSHKVASHRLIATFAARAVLTYESIQALRFKVLISEYISELLPRVVLVPFEGHSYERITFLMCHKIDRNIVRGAYQHAVLFPEQHALKRSLGSELDPDVILASGVVGNASLRAAYQNCKVVVDVLGSARATAREKWRGSKSRIGSAPLCLALPDGNPEECILMCRYVLGCAQLIPSVNFLIRLHPMIPIARLRAMDRIFDELPSNLAFSVKSDLKEDAASATWAIYRGSGAIIHSVALGGCRPVYLDDGRAFDIDPLFQLDVGKKIVTSSIDLSLVIKSDCLKSPKDLATELEDVIAYCRSYFLPLDYELLPRILCGKLNIQNKRVRAQSI